MSRSCPLNYKSKCLPRVNTVPLFISLGNQSSFIQIYLTIHIELDRKILLTERHETKCQVSLAFNASISTSIATFHWGICNASLYEEGSWTSSRVVTKEGPEDQPYLLGGWVIQLDLRTLFTGFSTSAKKSCWSEEKCWCKLMFGFELESVTWLTDKENGLRESLSTMESWQCWQCSKQNQDDKERNHEMCNSYSNQQADFVGAILGAKNIFQKYNQTRKFSFF